MPSIVQEALQRLIDGEAGGADEELRDALVTQALLDGTGFFCAGVARFCADRTHIAVTMQGRARPLVETTSLEVSEVASARAILAGGTVGIAECSDKALEDDALIRGLRVVSYFAEPLISGEGVATGFLFVANDLPVDQNTHILERISFGCRHMAAGHRIGT